MNLKDISDADLQAEARRRYESRRKLEMAGHLLRKYAIDERWGIDKKMTVYQANAACVVLCTALKIDTDHLLEAMFEYANTVGATSPATSED